METGLTETNQEKLSVYALSLHNNYGFFKIGSRPDWIFKNCCSIVKTDTSIKKRIPVDWANAFNHSFETVTDWVNLINEALNVDIKINEEVVEYDSARHTILSFDYPATVDDSYSTREMKKIEGSCKILNNEFYEFEINTGCSRDNYACFVLLRFLGNYHYYPVVQKALKIKNILKYSNNKALTSILMAFASGDYDPEYGLFEPWLKSKIDYLNPGFTNHSDYLNDSWKTIKTPSLTTRKALIDQDWEKADFSAFNQYY